MKIKTSLRSSVLYYYAVQNGFNKLVFGNTEKDENKGIDTAENSLWTQITSHKYSK